VSLYHSLNNWTSSPDSVDALESPDSLKQFQHNTHARYVELVKRFNPIDVLWHDGWWPFNQDGWQAETLNQSIRKIQPHVLFNCRNGLPGDFSTPEGHMSAPRPWRPWEGCMTLNDSWGYHRGDHNWKSPTQVVNLLTRAAAGNGNLLLNIGPRGDGSIPEKSVDILRTVGKWLKTHGECIYDTEPFTWGLESREGHNADWNHNGPFTLKGRSMYQIVLRWPGQTLTVAGLNTKVERVELLGVGPCPFTQSDTRVVVTGLPEQQPNAAAAVMRFDCRDVPEMYLTGGMRVPACKHPPYDPCPSEIQD